MKRIENGEKVKTVFNDFKMSSEIHNNNQLDEVEKNEYEARIEMGNKKIIDIYNETNNIKLARKQPMKTYFRGLLEDIKSNRITI